MLPLETAVAAEHPPRRGLADWLWIELLAALDLLAPDALDDLTIARLAEWGIAESVAQPRTPCRWQ